MTFHNAHLSAHGFIGIGTHTAIPLPPPASMLPHISASSLLGFTIKAKFSKREFGPGGFNLMGRGSDSGYIVPHISIPPTNFLLAVIIPLGSSKIMFGSSKVHIHVDGKAEHCGCCTFPIVPLSLNMACNDPCSYPGDFVIAPNTVEVSMTLGDVLMGIVSAAIDVALSYVIGKGAGKIGGGVVNRLARRRLGSTVLWEWAGTLGPESGREFFNLLAKEMADSTGGQIVTGFVNEAVKAVMGTAIDYTIKDITSGDASSLGDFADKSALGIVNESPATDTRIYGTSGDGVQVSEWF